MTWDEPSAREWLSSSWAPMSLLLRGSARSKGSPVEWHEPRELPERFRTLHADEHRCLEAAFRAFETFPSLTIAAGFSFRPQCPDAGIAHFLCLDSEGLPVDPALSLYPEPLGYLLVRPTAPQLSQLADANNVTLPPMLAAHLAALAAQTSPPAQARMNLGRAAKTIFPSENASR